MVGFKRGVTIELLPANKNWTDGWMDGWTDGRTDVK
jgi:hypothetical protein